MIPAKIAKGQRRMNLFRINIGGISPCKTRTVGKMKKGIREEMEYLSKDITIRIKTTVVISFALGSSACRAVFFRERESIKRISGLDFAERFIELSAILGKNDSTGKNKVKFGDVHRNSLKDQFRWK